MTTEQPAIWCIKCPATFQTEEEAKAHFHKEAHGWTAIWKHGYDGRIAEDAKRKKDRRRRTSGKESTV